MDWMALLQAASLAQRKEWEETYGEDPRKYPQVGCGMPWARGKGVLMVEFKMKGEEWQCFVSDMLPELWGR